MNNFNKLYDMDLELRLAAHVFEAHEAIIITDNSLKVLRVNKAYTDITGFAPEEIIGKTTKIHISSIQNKDYYRNMREIITANGYWEGELYNQRKNGELYPALLSISAVKDEKGNVSHYVGHLKDLADYKNKECALSRKFDEERVLSNLMNLSFKPMDEFLQQAIEQITAIEWLRLEPTGGIFLTRNEGKANMMKLVCNYNLDQHVSEQCAHIIFGECLCGRAARSKQIQFCSDIDDPRHEFRYPGIKPHGHYNVPLLHGNKVLGVLSLYLAAGHKKQQHEISFLKRVAEVLALGVSQIQAEKKIQFLAYHNDLTKLPNRLLLLDRLKQLILLGKRQVFYSAIIYIDFDRFSKINDLFGSSVGDALLIEIAQRFNCIVRHEDTLAHLGEDQFAILMTHIKENHNQAMHDIQTLIHRLQLIIADDFQIGGHELMITFCVGIVVDDACKTPDNLLRQAKTAMYQAKEEGPNCIRFFKPEMHPIANSRLEMENDLRYAIKRGELISYYQPQINDDGEMIGAEALLRWRHRKIGFISPRNFIPLAEEAGLILPIGYWVLEDVCRQIKKWENKPQLQHVAVNISSIQFKYSGFLETIKKILDKTQINPKKLMLELTEGILVAVGQVDAVINKMQAIKNLGIQLSIDDFGTGYSSLAYLKSFPIDQLKIDKSFVDDIGVNENDYVIVETIIAMADRMGFDLIAEGVETEEQLKFLQQKGCGLFQGYYFDHPLPAEKFNHKYL